ncbi:MAG: Swt1 family HEPN domain-containing protein [Candidatus Aminicenantales bacterium]|jgi:hypothetical protein
MTAYRKLRAELLKRLKCSPQALSQRISTIRKHIGPFSTKEGVYIVAHEQGLDLSKYIGQETMAQVRAILSRKTHSPAPPPIPIRRSKKTALIKLNNELPRVDALLSTSLVEDARKMSGIYPTYYVLENSLRVVIIRILERKYGSDWWEKKVPVDPKRNVASRKSEEDKKPWTGKRGQHEIFYSDFKDLKSIIRANAADFKPIFMDLEWIAQKLTELENPRNIVAHHNPLDKNDIKRIEVFFADWIKLLGKKKQLIPA